MTKTHGSGEMKLIDPIAVFVDGKRPESGAADPPLVSMHIDVTIRGGLALVETVRTYKNREAKPIEALLSIPVPVHAAFFGLSARIGGTVHTANAFPRSEARDAYEDAIEGGKAAVLHVELLRGVHALSVANLAPRDDAEITIRWAEPLRYRDSVGYLRIPLTVGDVYGQSGLPDVDELVHGGPEPPTTVRIQHDATSVRLVNVTPDEESDGKLFAKVPGSAPVDIAVTGWTCRELIGRASDGRNVRLVIKPAPNGNQALDMAILVDHSGSMDSLCEGGSGVSISKHQAVKTALLKLDDQFRDGDRIALWEFNQSCRSVGETEIARPYEFSSLASRLSEPRGGTEIGAALHTIAHEEVWDVLLITDGKTYALDVEEHALAGRRVFVVLVGEDSLEANVGHLAAITGGDIQFTLGGDVERALAACVGGMRLRRSLDETCQINANYEPQLVRTARAGAFFEARWGVEATDSLHDSFAEAVAAYSASLAIAASSEMVGTAIAVDEGLVTHLTSLFLAVEGAEPLKDLSELRKLRLPSPRSTVSSFRAHRRPAPGPRVRRARSSSGTMTLASVSIESTRREIPPVRFGDRHLERPPVQVTGSRDPLGVQPLRKAFGRQIIANVTSANNSLRGYAVLLLGRYFGESLLADGRIREEDAIDVFLRVEQVCGYATYLALGDSGASSERIPGIARIRKRVAKLNKVVRIGITPNALILSNQKTSGVWGRFSASARKSNLIAKGPIGLSTQAREFVEEAYLSKFNEKERVLNQLESLFAYGGTLRLEPRPKALLILGRILGRPTSQLERNFYRRYVCDGELCDQLPPARQATLCRLLEAHSDLYQHISRDELAAIRWRAQAENPGLATRIGRILALEALLVPSEALFRFLETSPDPSPVAIEATIKDYWGAGVPGLYASEFREMADEIEYLVGSDVMTHMAGVHEGLMSGKYGLAVECLVEWNRLVTGAPYAPGWGQFDAPNVRDVRHHATYDLLPTTLELRSMLGDDYYINTLKALVAQTAEMPRREAQRMLLDESRLRRSPPRSVIFG